MIQFAEIEMKPVECDYYSISGAARYLGVSRGTIDHYLAKGILPYEDRPPGRGKGIYRNIRIRRTDLDRLREMWYRTKAPKRQTERPDRIILLPRT